MKRKHMPQLTPRAKELRKEMTPEERHLWYDFLRSYPERFLRQKVVDGYIVDFYCAKADLVIELDGSQHFLEDGVKYDQVKDNCLRGWGLEVLRFANNEVSNQFSSVCQQIDNTVKKRISVRK